MGKTPDQKRVDAFLKELVGKVSKRFGSEIDFIILYGSAARGEFVCGASDIDLTIQMKREDAVPAVKEFAEEIFWKLDKKHGTQFRKVCSAKKPKMLMGKIIKEFERQTFLYVPIFVFGPNDVDWKNGRYLQKGYKLLADIFAPAAPIFLKLKWEGKILYGRDIRPYIKPRITMWERFKYIMHPFWVAWGAAIIVNINPKKAVKNASKAVLYDIDGALFYLDKLKKASLEAKKKKLKSSLDFKFSAGTLTDFLELNLDIKYKAINPKKFDIIEEALRYKLHGFKGSRKEAGKFVYRAWAFVNAMNWIVMIKRLLRIH